MSGVGATWFEILPNMIRRPDLIGAGWIQRGYKPSASSNEPPGSCPVCGTANMACKGEEHGVAPQRRGQTSRRGPMGPSQDKSAVSIVENKEQPATGQGDVPTGAEVKGDGLNPGGTEDPGDDDQDDDVDPDASTKDVDGRTSTDVWVDGDRTVNGPDARISFQGVIDGNEVVVSQDAVRQVTSMGSRRHMYTQIFTIGTRLPLSVVRKMYPDADIREPTD